MNAKLKFIQFFINELSFSFCLLDINILIDSNLHLIKMLYFFILISIIKFINSDPIPAELDWRTKGAVLPVPDQVINYY